MIAAALRLGRRIETLTLGAPLRSLMALYLLLLVLLPSGSIFGVNVKVICFMALLPVVLQVAFTSGQMTRRHLSLILCVPAILLLWTMLAQIYGFDPSDALAQYKDILVTISTCWFAVVLANGCSDGALYLLRAVVRAAVITSTLKVLLLAYAFLRGIPVSAIIEIVNQTFKVQLMPYDLESLLGRLQFISDNVIPIAMFAILMYRKALRLTGFRAIVMLMVLLVSDLFSFSRYLYVFTVLAFVLGLMFAQRDRFKIALVSLVSLLTLVSLPLLITLVTLRFSSSVVESSDADRIIQSAALKFMFLAAPWFGHGLGSFAPTVIRSDTAPYSYELQVLALSAQIGVIGMILLTLLTAYFFRALWPLADPAQTRTAPRKLGLALLLAAWLIGGFFNPSIISSAAAVSYVAIYAMGQMEATSGLRGSPRADDGSP